jgi:thiosulfate/3-mercaptopyruvate sulfurtransferase
MAVMDTTIQSRGYGLADALVEPQWLQSHLHDPGLQVVEVDVSPVAYNEGHIEGAVLWNVYRDLKDPTSSSLTRQRSKNWSLIPGSTPHDGCVLWLRARPGLLAHEALSPRRCAHP